MKDTEDNDRYVLFVSENKSEAMYIRRCNNASLEEVFNKPVLTSFGNECEKAFRIRSVMAGCEPFMKIITNSTGNMIVGIYNIEEDDEDAVYEFNM